MTKLYTSIFRKIIQRTPSVLVMFSMIFSALFTSCVEMVPMVFHGTIEEMMFETDVKKINIPFWVVVFGGLAFFVCLLCSFIASILVRSLRPETTRFKLKYWSYFAINVLIYVGVMAITMLLGFFAFSMEILDFDWFFNFPLFFQIGLILLVCVYALVHCFTDLKKLGLNSPIVDTFNNLGRGINKKLMKHIDSDNSNDDMNDDEKQD